MWLLAAAIAFGPLGPPQHRTFSDGAVRATIVFRMAQYLKAANGPAATGPSVAAGTLTVSLGGRRRTYDLASILPIHNALIEIPARPPYDGCGIAHVFAHAGTYLAIQAILTGKGCAPIAAFLDLASGEVAENVVLDHSWNHRFDSHPSAFAGETLRVTRADRVVLDAVTFSGLPISTQPAHWPFVIVHTLTATGGPHAIAYCTACSYPAPAAGSEKLPTVGSRIRVGEFSPSSTDVLLMFEAERTVLLSPADEARYDALQTPAPPTPP